MQHNTSKPYYRQAFLLLLVGVLGWLALATFAAPVQTEQAANGIPLDSTPVQLLTTLPATTPTPTVTPTPTSNRPPCPHSAAVEPVLSPTNQLSQTIVVHAEAPATVRVSTSSGNFTALPGSAYEVPITLLPNTVHNLTVTVDHHRIGGSPPMQCIETRTYDKLRVPLVIVQRTISAPTNLQTMAVATTRIDLSWQDNATNEGGFRIERCTSADCTEFVEVAIVGVNVTTYASRSLSADTYCYRVRAYTTDGLTSAYTAPACATTLPIPPAWSGIRTISERQIDLSWHDRLTTATGFVIERCTTEACTDPLQVAMVTAETTNYQDTNLTANTFYYYRLYAYNDSGNSRYTRVLGRSTGPNPPTNLTAVGTTPRQITLNWQDNADNETGFRLSRCTGDACNNFTWNATVRADITQYNNRSLTTNGTYCYRLHSYSDDGPSSYTPPVCATTLVALTSAEADATADGEEADATRTEGSALQYRFVAADGVSTQSVAPQSPFTFQAQPTCVDGTPPLGVELFLGDQQYLMQGMDTIPDTYSAMVNIAPSLLADSSYAVNVEWQCANEDDLRHETLGVVQVTEVVDQPASVPTLVLFLPLISNAP